ncbi:Uncharacterised protein [Mycobacterium tuberculosis]|nr:Uncharacterised protein [Mycobacterium tuberculosis]
MDRVRRVVTDRDSGAGALARHPLAGRRTDPQLAAFYHRLMTTQRHCHTQATIAVARKLAERTRVTITTGRPYQLRDTDAEVLTRASEVFDLTPLTLPTPAQLALRRSVIRRAGAVIDANRSWRRLMSLAR